MTKTVPNLANLEAITLPLPDQSEPSDSPACDWYKAYDGCKLFYRYWAAPVGSPVLIYLHGVESHGQWFEHSASELHKAGIGIYAPDRRGSGRNTQARGDITSYRQFLADIDCFFELVKACQPKSPIFLLGNCWGAKTAIAMAREFDLLSIPLAGLILTCPAIKVNCDLDLVSKLKLAFCWLTRSKATFALPLRSEMFTGNPIYIDYIEHDPLRLKEVTASFCVETLKLRALAAKSWSSINLPLLVLQAGRDQISDAAAARQWFDQVDSPDKAFHLFDQMAHSLDFEPDSQEYTELMIAWIGHRSRVPA